jgi:hypothetical protein
VLIGIGNKREEDRTLHYHFKNGWSVIPDPHDEVPEDIVDYHPALFFLGYEERPLLRLGTDYNFSVEWRRGSEGKNPPYPNVITIEDTGAIICEVYTSDFPSTFEFLHKLSTLAQAAMFFDVYDSTRVTRHDQAQRTHESDARKGK